MKKKANKKHNLKKYSIYIDREYQLRSCTQNSDSHSSFFMFLIKALKWGGTSVGAGVVRPNMGKLVKALNWGGKHFREV